MGYMQENNFNVDTYLCKHSFLGPVTTRPALYAGNVSECRPQRRKNAGPWSMAIILQGPPINVMASQSHQLGGCLFSRGSGHHQRNNEKSTLMALCEGNLPAQKASGAEGFSKWWSRHIYILQATGLDAWVSRVKCPARFVSHLHDIRIWVVYSFCLVCCLFIIVTTQFVAWYKPCKPKSKPPTYDPPDNHPLAEIQRPMLRPEPKQQICHLLTCKYRPFRYLSK